ncbi:hypothetical protein GDO86_011610 [Hymenochirus boettgeri]|uniref:Collagen alpha-6(VI) chain n=1 Tax=Hymenochirus boettgeri TaxID=247094 RepID=A0A8T2JH20_9PIPI|nr:hypothetical protein GDO86_011610 [Hymenochirus boettgeri]KAG8442863.1 hypothetical protein GDO86_011610 [Hymenochirus boettgeri]
MELWKVFFICLVSGCTLQVSKSQKTVCTEANIADIVFLLDGSWSIGTENFKTMQNFLYTLINGFDVGQDKIRIALVQYSDNARTEFYLNSYSHKEDVLQYIQTLKYKGGGTKTGLSLEFMLKNHFTESAGSRAKEGVPQIAVVITDGQAQDNIREPAIEVKNAGIILYAVGIKDAVLTELNEIASDPDDKHVYSVADFNALQGISQNMIQVLCTTVEEAVRQTGQIAMACRTANQADIVFLLESTTRMGEEIYEKAKNYVYDLVSSLDVGINKIRVGLVQYSDETHVKFLLNEYSLKSEILGSIQSLKFMGGDPYTGRAFEIINSTVFTESAGSRSEEGVAKILIVMTEGASEDSLAGPARELKSRGISVYVAGVNIKDIVQLQKASSKPIAKYFYQFDSFEDTEEVTSSLLQNLCFTIDVTIQAFSKRYADVVFLVDSSSKMGTSLFERVKDLIAIIIKQLNIGVNKHRIGLAQYSGDPHTEFLLNTYETKEEIIDHIKKKIVFRGGPLNTGRALEFLRSTFFIEEAGSRIKYGNPQFVVFITSSKSEDDVKRNAEELRHLGVKTISVGIRNSDRKELETIATDPFVFQIKGAQNISILQEDVVNVILAQDMIQFSPVVHAPAVCSSASVADIVFLIDESSSIGTLNFQLTRVFLHKVISALDIGLNSVRVGLVLYSDEPRLEFKLNTFTEEYEMLDYITKLPYRGGKTYTGAALDFIRKKMFTKQGGSRADQGVQQIAVIMTNGQSLDNFTKSASKLRRSGVEVFAVGFQDVSKSELKSIASHPPNKHVTTVESFLQLSNLELRLQKRLCSEIVTKSFATPYLVRSVKEGCVDTEEADIYFLIDGSTSIYSEDFDDMKKFMNDLTSMFQVGANRVRFGVVQYSFSPRIEFTIDTYNTQKKLKDGINQIYQMTGGTLTGEALRAMIPLFENAAQQRPHKVPQSLIVITDGESQDSVAEAAADIRNNGINIYAIGVKNAVEEQLRDIAGSQDKMFFVNNFDSLKVIKNELARDLCTPQACKNMKADILFLVDSSASINPDDYEKMKDFMDSMVKQADIGPDRVQIGLIQFSSETREEFALNKYRKKNEIQEAIERIRQMQQGTLTGQALTDVLPYFSTARGGREKTKQYLIIITDGEAQDTVEKPAKAIRDYGVTIYAIGVQDANNTQLLEIAGKQEQVYFEDNFDALAFLNKQIMFEICNPEDSCKKTEMADIIFLIDASTSISRGEFRLMQRFMEALVNDSLVGKTNVQFGAVVYSTDPAEQFSLNSYSTKLDVLEAIKKLPQIHGYTYTAKALEYTRVRFGPSYGGRSGVSHILILITDGETTSADRPNLPVVSKSLKDDGILVFAVGVSMANPKELQQIAGQPDRWFLVQDYKALDTLHENITQIVCNETKPACSHEQLDLVFLIDGSASITPSNFTTMRTFMKGIVDSFNIGQNKVRIGVAQYSTNPKKEFFLNEFYTSSELKKHIDSISQLKSTTYTGKGLRFVKQFFDPANGSRKNAGVPQYLIVMTDGMSNDSVAEDAAALRSSGVHIFTIGIGLRNSFELVQISGTPKNVYEVERFEVLESIKRKIVGQVCEPQDEPTKDCSVDITISVDYSRRARPTTVARVQQRLKQYLPEVVQRIATLSNISCASGSQINLRFRYAVAAQDTLVFDSDFEKYSEEVIKKFINEQSAVDTYLNVHFLQSLWNKYKGFPAQNVKVILVFTDGLDESFDTLKMTTESLRNQGLDALLFVALEGVQDSKELLDLQFGRGFSYQQPLTIGLLDLPSLMLKEIDTVTERKCCNVICKCSGQEGPRGPIGSAGFKGQPGIKGSQGHPGEEGGYGERGLRGLNGTRGEAGCPGRRGVKGTRGIRGDKGDHGEIGIDGVNGEQGNRGAHGVPGESGSPGAVGRKGPRGEPGEKGESGLRGDPGDPGTNSNISGPKGLKGNLGRQGEPGNDGVQGGSGEKGPNGPQGRRGPPGLKGERGIPGELGNKGDKGIQGIQGSQGLQGPPGQQGSQGAPGSQGATGAPGIPGSIGRPGAPGPKGEPGDLGQRGELGIPGRRGLPGADGADGYGSPGLKGEKGHIGFPGYPGPQGEDGLSGRPGGAGPKGNTGRRGKSGLPGTKGAHGDIGPPGPRGSKGSPGIMPIKPCELITFTRENCPCLSGSLKCPVYPTEIVFALDSSQDVPAGAFQRMKNIIISMIEKLDITESNCPSGARVAVVSYNSNTKHLIRFFDYKRKTLLLEAIRGISPERSSSRRNIGEAMRFVGRNVFKRIRHGINVRKVAVFFANGPSQDAIPINTAVLEYSALDIIPVVIAFNDVPNVKTAFSADETRKFQVFVWNRPQDQRLELISHCTLCYDKCTPDEECELEKAPPTLLDMDITFVMDSSRSVGSDEFEKMKGFVSNMLDTFYISSKPRDSDTEARVALVQQAVSDFRPKRNMSPVKTEFDFFRYNNANQMKGHIKQSVTQLDGTSAVGYSMQWVIDNIFLKAPKPRKNKVLFLILGSSTSYWDRENLKEVSLKAKCQGFIIFVLGFGRMINDAELSQLSSFPHDQHSLYLTSLSERELAYGKRFSHAFLNLLDREINKYPPSVLQAECKGRGDASFTVFRSDEPGTEVVQIVLESEAEHNGQGLTQHTEKIERIEEVVVESGPEETLGRKTEKRIIGNDICTLKQEEGDCSDYILKWSYHQGKQMCEQFWYGGCGGNGNRFDTQEQCEAICLSSN